jgi:hypothetical protein
MDNTTTHFYRESGVGNRGVEPIICEMCEFLCLKLFVIVHIPGDVHQKSLCKLRTTVQLRLTSFMIFRYLHGSINSFLAVITILILRQGYLCSTFCASESMLGQMLTTILVGSTRSGLCAAFGAPGCPLMFHELNTSTTLVGPLTPPFLVVHEQ